MTDFDRKMTSIVFRDAARRRVEEAAKVPKMVIEEWACREILPKYKRLRNKLEKATQGLDDEPSLRYDREEELRPVAFLVEELERMIAIYEESK